MDKKLNEQQEVLLESMSHRLRLAYSDISEVSGMLKKVAGNNIYNESIDLLLKKRIHYIISNLDKTIQEQMELYAEHELNNQQGVK